MNSSISEILEVFPEAKFFGDKDINISGITHDSRDVETNFMFCCVVGENVDGHKFASAAIESGACILLVERRLDFDVPQLLVSDVREAMGYVSSSIYDHPSKELTIIGVTGTNGKSSVVQMLQDIWLESGIQSEIFGTLQGKRTTPEAPDLQRLFRQSVDRGVDAIAMEVSSHALELGRVNGTQFDLTIFTNLSHDHLDFHGNMEAYFNAKAKLFTSEFTSRGVVNSDDPYGKKIGSQLPDCRYYSLADAEDLIIDGPNSTYTWESSKVSLSLAGSYNVSNALAASTAAKMLGVEVSSIVKGLEKTRPVAGRFEIVSDNHPFWVTVDYAHTPDALEAVLKAAREISKSDRVIVVFGCGGDRDAKKRPEMGNVAEDKSDLAVLTTDNPRSEDASDIAAEVMSGVQDPDSVFQIPDRRKAIEFAISEAEDGDVVVIAGKGHESGQTIGDVVHEFNDVEVATEILGAIK